MGKVGAIAVGLMFSGLALGLSGCKQEKVNNFSQSEQLLNECIPSSPEKCKNIVAGWRQNTIGYSDSQLSIDSAAYRNIFNSTSAVKDSAKVAEFNRIAMQNKIPKYIKTDIAAGLYLSRKLRAKELPLEEFKQANNYAGFLTDKGIINSLSKKQYVIDSISYNQFFEKHGIRTKEVERQVKKISRKIKP